MTEASFAWLKKYAAEMDDVCPQDTELGAWYLSVDRHVAEFFAMNLLLLAIFFASKTPLSQLVPASSSSSSSSPSHKASTRSAVLRLLDTIGLLGSVCTLTLVIYHKYNEDRLPFLLQPCHAMNALIIVIYLFPARSQVGTFLFNIYLQCYFSPLLGMFAANLSCYTQWLELETWFVSHLLLIMFPFWCIATDRFAVIDGMRFFVFGFSIEALWHFLVMAPVSIITGMNINFMLCPPGGAKRGVLTKLGVWYRPGTTVVMLLLALLARFVVLEGFVVMCRKFGLVSARDEEVELRKKKDE